ncbi:hypothetical protein [Catellatospora vulcania]|uniref:hypothetical protein n=1 Tax=Catellatospora vulcania TaxID=1460450 RepID=UPI0012D387D3|nr:hypothetical protein [Catellatospora vulcania]
MQNLDLAVDELLTRQPWLLDLYRRRPGKAAHLCPWRQRARLVCVAANERAALTDVEGRR